ncbi:MAG: DUF4317 family protein [Candidatus Pelethousia sp.]|nr:DUF4317 family protein [Candidatus Pelethousia sp.]
MCCICTRSAKQAVNSNEHKLLSMLRQDGRKNVDMLLTFYQRITESLNMGGNYLILLTHDVYTVPYTATDGEIQKDASDEEFSYILCSICPVKLTPKELSCRLSENRFHTTQGSIVSAPELGFLFSAFEDTFEAHFGTDAQLTPANMIDKKQFVIRTPDLVIKVDSERSDLIETR